MVKIIVFNIKYSQEVAETGDRTRMVEGRRSPIRVFPLTQVLVGNVKSGGYARFTGLKLTNALLDLSVRFRSAVCHPDRAVHLVTVFADHEQVGRKKSNWSKFGRSNLKSRNSGSFGGVQLIKMDVLLRRKFCGF